MKMTIEGIGIVSSAGCGVDELRRSLSTDLVTETFYEDIETPEGVRRQALLRADIKGLDAFVEKRLLRRVDRFSQMALLASFQALADSGLEKARIENAGIIFGSGYGAASATFSFLDSVINDGDNCASPTFFALSVHNSLAAQVSSGIGIKGPVQTFSNFSNTVYDVLEQAGIWLKNSDAEYVLAGFGDEHCPVRTYVSASYGCACLPGEGFVALLLSMKADGKYGWIDMAKADCGDSSSLSFEKFFGKFPTSAAMDIVASALDEQRYKTISEKTFGDKYNIYRIMR